MHHEEFYIPKTHKWRHKLLLTANKPAAEGMGWEFRKLSQNEPTEDILEETAHAVMDQMII